MLVYPVNDPPRIAQKFGTNTTGVSDFYTRFGLPAHEGIDFGGAKGDDIFSAGAGVVIALTLDNGVHAYGNHVRIKHLVDAQEYTSVYAHLSSFSPILRVGDSVMARNYIGEMGDTGNAFGVHLHFALKKKGATARGELQRLADGRMVVYPNDLVDPLPYFK